jgi:Ser/Thr protein kinase RdoA (MazF antagonist)
MTWHTVFYYYHEPVVIDDPAYVILFSPARRELIHEVAAAAKQVLQELAQSTPDRILIHGDLHPYNVHVARGCLYVLDFEDVLFGYPVQDIAITFAAFRRYPDCESLWRAFEAGEGKLSRYAAIVARTIEQIRAVFHELGEGKDVFGLLHADLHQENYRNASIFAGR